MSGRMSAATDLRRAEAVVAAGIIGPLRVAEIDRGVGERVGAQGLPDGIDQIGAGFHYKHHVAAPGDVEAEAIRPHPEEAVARLRLRVPQNGGTTAKRVAPTRSSR